jgi:hypothetical protein
MFPSYILLGIQIYVGLFVYAISLSLRLFLPLQARKPMGQAGKSATISTRSSSDNSLAHHLSPTSRSDRSSLAFVDITAYPHPIAPSVTHRVLHVVAFWQSELSLRLPFITLFVSSWKGESYFLDKKLFTQYDRCLAGARFDVMHGFVCSCSPSNARISSKSRHSFRDENQNAIHLTWRKLEL